jgi:hypothetical protein
MYFKNVEPKHLRVSITRTVNSLGFQRFEKSFGHGIVATVVLAASDIFSAVSGSFCWRNDGRDPNAKLRLPAGGDASPPCPARPTPYF